jgi:hypothetical protein
MNLIKNLFNSNHSLAQEYSSVFYNHNNLTNSVLENLLIKSNNLKLTITDYVKEYYKEKLGINHIDYTKQFYIIDDHVYYLEDSDWEQVYKLMMTHNNFETVAKGISNLNSINSQSLTDKLGKLKTFYIFFITCF